MNVRSDGSARPDRVVVVGGGVIGVCAAWFLAERGAAVLLLERDRLAAGASEGNAGTISPGHPPINRPGRVGQAVRSLTDPLRPLYVAPRFDPGLARWLVAFARHCSAAQAERGMAALAPLGLATPELFERLVSEAEIDCDYRTEGYLEVFLSPAGIEAGRTEIELCARHGFEPEPLTGDALREREPALGASVRGGWHHPEGATVDPARFLRGLAEDARRKGVQVREEAEVGSVRIEAGRAAGVRLTDGEEVDADAVLLCTGAYSPGLLDRLGRRLPVQPAKGYHVDRDPEAPGTPPLGTACLLAEGSVFCTPMSGFVRFAGTLEFSGINHEIRQDRLRQLTRVASRYLPDVAEAEPLSRWVGLRPCTPDGLPAIGPIPGHDGLFVATGHAMLGLTLGPITGKLLAERILEGKSPVPLAPFAPARFL
jgi:D-amino-acid dehydrogenase